MQNFLKELMTQFGEFAAQRTRTQKLIAASFLSVVVLLCIGIVVWNLRKPVEYEVLYSLLDRESANEIKADLDQRSMHYKLREEPQGWTILVPRAEVMELRLDMATKVDSMKIRPGWDIFDKTTLGETSQKTDINVLRAMEGEREKTLRAIKGVRSARVNLAIPKESLFVPKEEQKPKASVLLTLMPHTSLKDEQVRTIQALVAGGIEGLEADNVVVADSEGNELSKIEEVDPGIKLLEERATLIEQQKGQRREYERYLEMKILNAFERVFGEGHVTANVNVQFDFTEKRETSIVYDKENSAPVAEMTTLSGIGDAPRLAQGITGSATHVENVSNPGAEDAQSRRWQQESVTNWEVARTEVQTNHAPYMIQRIGAAVMVDNMPQTSTDEDGNPVQTREPLSEQQLLALENQVKRIINYSEERPGGLMDEVSVTNVPFNILQDDRRETTIVAQRRKEQNLEYLKWGVLAFSLLLVFVFLVRPLMRIVLPSDELPVEGPQELALPGAERVMLEGPSAASLEEAAAKAGLPAPERAEEEEDEREMKVLDEEILELVRGNPKKVPLVLRAWLEKS